MGCFTHSTFTSINEKHTKHQSIMAWNYVRDIFKEIDGSDRFFKEVHVLLTMFPGIIDTENSFCLNRRIHNWMRANLGRSTLSKMVKHSINWKLRHKSPNVF